MPSACYRELRTGYLEDILNTSTTLLTTQRELDELCERFKLDGIGYCIDFVDIRRHFKNPTRSVTLPKRIANRQAHFFSSSSVKHYFDCWFHRWMRKDDNLMNDLRLGTHLWHYPRDQYTTVSPLSDLNRFGYQHRLSIVLQCPISNMYITRFALFCNDSSRAREILRNGEELRNNLEHFHFKAVARHRGEINPFFDLGIIKPKTGKVLQQISEGQSRNDISKACNLTCRGVDYHIDVLKSTLEANNIVSMVHKAQQLYLI